MTHKTTHRPSGHRAGDQPLDPIVLWGWILSILLFPIGAILAVIAITRGRVGQGIAMLVIGFLIFLSLLSI